MSNSNLKQLIVTSVIVAAGLYGFWYYRTHTDDYLSTQEAFSPTEKMDPRSDLSPEIKSPEATVTIQPEKPMEEKPLEAVAPVVNHKAVFEAQQKILKETFQNKIKLHMKLPENMDYQEMDLDENVVGIFGREQGSSKKLSIMATDASTNVEGVVKYLNESRKANPMLGEKEFKVSGKTLTFPPPANSGLGTVTVIPGGETLYAAYVQRNDKKGSYLFMMEASASYFNNNDDGFEQLLESIKLDP